MKVEWREHLSVGVEEIDDQHKRLFDKFNALIQAYEEGKGAAELVRMFDFLDEYVVTHFADEERLQKKLGYPDHARHREQHQSFIREMATLKGRLRAEGSTKVLVSTVSRVITGWLIEHISGMDRALGRFAREGRM